MVDHRFASDVSESSSEVPPNRSGVCLSSEVSVQQFLPDRPVYDEESLYADLLKNSIAKLRQDQYRYWQASKRLLLENLRIEDVSTPTSGLLEQDPHYTHACLYWHVYLTSVRHVSAATLAELNGFLAGNEFVHWSEYLYQLRNGTGLEAQVRVAAEIRMWHHNLNQGQRSQLSVDGLFVLPYENLRTELSEVSGDALAEFWPLTRLGEYLNLAGASFQGYRRASNYRCTVADGLSRHLDRDHPLVLRTEQNVLSDYL